MDRDQAIAALRTLEPKLKGAGVLGVSVFGSVARGDAGPESDLDVAVRLDAGFSQGGMDYFWRLDQLRQQFSELLGCNVDVVAEPVRNERVKAEIDRDRVLAF